MEAVAAPDHQPISPCRQIKTLKRHNISRTNHHHHQLSRSFSLKQSSPPRAQSFTHASFHQGGGPFHTVPPLPLSHNYYAPPPLPPQSSSSTSAVHQHNQKQPPLLPLPKPYASLSSVSVSLPHPNIDKKPHAVRVAPPSKRSSSNKTKKDQSLTKPPAQQPRGNKQPNGLLLPSKDGFGGDFYWEEFSGSILHAISPPPSSLPLPRFSLRPPKLSCTAEAAAAEIVDSGATDDLRRMLRLL